MQEPLPLTHRKSALHLFAACQRFGLALSTLAPAGIAIPVCVFERGALAGWVVTSLQCTNPNTKRLPIPVGQRVYYPSTWIGLLR